MVECCPQDEGVVGGICRQRLHVIGGWGVRGNLPRCAVAGAKGESVSAKICPRRRETPNKSRFVRQSDRDEVIAQIAPTAENSSGRLLATIAVDGIVELLRCPAGRRRPDLRQHVQASSTVQRAPRRGGEVLRRQD